jgi:F-type H+-transporting ATPase subunit b
MSIYRGNKRLRFFLVSVLVIALAGGIVLSAFAAEDQEGKIGFKEIWMQSWRVLNFLILAYFLVRLLREPLTRFFRESAQGIREHLQGTEEACIEAERQLEAVERRLESLDDEIQSLRRLIAEQGERERDKIIANARATAEHMLEKAKLEAGYRVRQAQRQLRREVIEEAVSISQERVRTAIGSRDQQRLIREYLQDLKQMPSLST